MKQTKNYRKGFTLVELLAVIVVLGIVLLIAVPNVLGIINNAKDGAFISTARIAASALKTQAVANDWMPDTNKCKVVPLRLLKLDDLESTIEDINSYVVIAKKSDDSIEYWVALKSTTKTIQLTKGSAADITVGAGALSPLKTDLAAIATKVLGAGGACTAVTQ